MTDENDTDTGLGRTRRTLLKGAGLLGVGALLPVAADVSDAGTGTGAPTDPDWTQEDGTSGQNASLSDGTAPVEDPVVRWEDNAGWVVDGVAIVDETVYVGTSGLTAHDLATGAERWGYHPDEPDEYDDGQGDSPSFGAPAVADGAVYAGLGWGPYDAHHEAEVLASVDAETGEKRWWFDPDGHTGYEDPVVADGTVYTIAWADDDEVFRLFSLDADASVNWTHDFVPSDELPRGAEPTRPAVADGRVHVGWGDAVRTLDAASGSQTWERSFDAVDHLMVVGGRVYFKTFRDSTSGVVALDAASGDEEWRNEWSQDEMSALRPGAASGDRVFLHTENTRGGEITALDAATGEQNWRTAVEEDPPPDITTDGMGVVGDHVYAGSVCLDAATGEVVWKHPAPFGASHPRRFAAAGHGVTVIGGGKVTVLEEPAGDGTDTTEGTETTTETTETTAETSTETDSGTTTTDGGDDGSTDTTPEVPGEC